MNNRVKTKRIVLSGILIAMVIVVLYISSMIPTMDISLFALSSFFVSIIVIEFGIKAGWVFYIASCLLSFIVIQNKVALIPYALFFGFYGIIKFYIERINKIFVEYLIKLVYFNVCLAFIYFFVREIFYMQLQLEFPWWVILIFLEIIYIIYDYVYSRFIYYYNTKLKKMLRI